MKRRAPEENSVPRKRPQAQVTKVKDEPDPEPSVPSVNTTPKPPSPILESAAIPVKVEPKLHSTKATALTQTAWTTPLSSRPAIPRAPRKSSQTAQCLVAKLFEDQGLLDSQATDSQAIAKLMAFADIMGMSGPTPQSSPTRGPIAPASPDLSQHKLTDNALVKAVLDGQVSPGWALANRVEHGTPPTVLANNAQSPNSSPPLVANLLHQFKEVATAAGIQINSAPIPSECSCGPCKRNRAASGAAAEGLNVDTTAVGGASTIAAGSSGTSSATTTHSSALPEHASSELASSSKEKGKAAVRPSQALTTPPRSSINQAPASIPAARESPIHLNVFERRLVLQLRQHLQFHNAALMQMLTNAWLAEKERELEVLVLKSEVERLERLAERRR
ncbi:hypothetical protein NMY22_g6987 [Coprinellus aureogranulatus]|nr:hypothetical protein NMY22_g6987 [Coprinellus aureogranulatus]